jgi:hypothetical protein
MSNRYKRKFRRLQKAVVELYTVAMWTPDRYVENEGELWANLRDAAGLTEGTKLALLCQGTAGFEYEER